MCEIYLGIRNQSTIIFGKLNHGFQAGKTGQKADFGGGSTKTRAVAKENIDYVMTNEFAQRDEENRKKQEKSKASGF